jgi:hypothetical protein
MRVPSEHHVSTVHPTAAEIFHECRAVRIQLDREADIFLQVGEPGSPLLKRAASVIEILLKELEVLHKELQLRTTTT